MWVVSKPPRHTIGRVLQADAETESLRIESESLRLITCLSTLIITVPLS